MNHIAVAIHYDSFCLNPLVVYRLPCFLLLLFLYIFFPFQDKHYIINYKVLYYQLNEKEEILELIDPVIVDSEGEQEEIEGCLSVPGKWAYTRRPMKVTVEATNRNGERFTVTGEGLTARAFCHEIDHLDGKLFIDEAVHILTDEEVKKYIG